MNANGLPCCLASGGGNELEVYSEDKWSTAASHSDMCNYFSSVSFNIHIFLSLICTYIPLLRHFFLFNLWLRLEGMRVFRRELAALKYPVWQRSGSSINTVYISSSLFLLLHNFHYTPNFLFKLRIHSEAILSPPYNFCFLFSLSLFYLYSVETIWISRNYDLLRECTCVLAEFLTFRIFQIPPGSPPVTVDEEIQNEGFSCTVIEHCVGGWKEKP